MSSNLTQGPVAIGKGENGNSFNNGMSHEGLG